MDAEAFAAVQVAHRLGSFGDLIPSLSQTARAFSLQASSAGTLAWDAGGARPYAANCWQLGRNDQLTGLRSTNPGTKSHKAVQTLQELLAAGLDFDVMIDMQDRRVRLLAGPDATIFPVVGFNRLNQAPGRILWPLPRLHDLGSDDYLGPFPEAEPLPFAQRQSKVVWRGALHGRVRGNDGDVKKEGMRREGVFAKLSKGKRDTEWVLASLRQFPRFAFVEALCADPRTDVGFVPEPTAPTGSGPFLDPLTRPRLSKLEQARFKYIAVIGGADQPSSYFWTMNSGSLAMVMDAPWPTFASVHFLPFEHFVPFKNDMSDFQDRLNWCEDHQPECEAMVAKAREVCQMLANADLRNRMDREVVDGLRQMLRAQT